MTLRPRCLAQVPSVLFAPSPLLALATSGQRSGIVCDMSAEELRVLPVRSRPRAPSPCKF